MTRTISARDANQRFSELLAQAAGGETVVITRRGKPVAQLSTAYDAATVADDRLQGVGSADRLDLNGGYRWAVSGSIATFAVRSIAAAIVP